MEKKTILGLLREENNAKTKEYLSSKPSYLTLLEKDIMIKRTAEELFRATKIIMRALNYRRLRRLRRESIFIADIYYEADPDIAKQIFLVGEFSTPQWGKQVLMQYSYFHRAFRAQIKIRQSSEFKFIVDGTFICCPKYPRLTTGGYTNNIFKKNPNPSGFNKSFHYEGVSLIMNDKRKWMIHSKKKTNKLSRFQLLNSFSRIRKDRSPRVDMAYKDRKKDFGIGIKHLHSSKAPKTPLQTIQKPLRSIISSEHNQSSRNLGSEYSDDDLFFLDDFFNNMPFTPDISGSTKDIGVYGISSPLRKEIVKNYCIVGQGFRLSKNKKPCQDAFFTSKFGIGIADGVGGWTSYGIDPAQFSNSLMSQCKQIFKRKEFAGNLSQTKSTIYKSHVQNFEHQQSPEAADEKTLSSQGKDFSKMESAFGARMRPKIRRIRSSFHLDEKELKECPTQENQCERSPISEVAFVETPKNFRLDPQQIIKQAYRAVTNFGSSTACVGALNGKTLKIANIGDSTIMVVRYNLEIKASKIMLRTGEQQHNFNAPYQLANIPHGLTPTSDAFEDHKRKFWKDKVSDAVLYQTTVREGDIIIGGTDGLFDNLYSHEVQNIIDVFMNDCFTNSSEDSLPSVNTQGFTPVFSKTQLEIFTKRNAKLLAHDLVKEAKRKSKNKACFTPFADRFNQAKVRMDKLLEWKGGKPDDICAVVGFVKNCQP